MDIRILTDIEAEWLLDHLTMARETAREFRVCWDGGLRVKAGGFMWSPPMGEIAPESRTAAR